MIWALKSLKDFHFNELLLFELKKKGVVTFHDIEEWYKIWRKTDLLLRKWLEEFSKFSPEHWKASKLQLWWDPFAQSRKCMTLKFTGELCVMTMKNDTKIEDELTCRFKIYMRNLTNLVWALINVKKIAHQLASLKVQRS